MKRTVPPPVRNKEMTSKVEITGNQPVKQFPENVVTAYASFAGPVYECTSASERAQWYEGLGAFAFGFETGKKEKAEKETELIASLKERNRLLRRECQAAIEMDAAAVSWQNTGDGRAYNKYERRRDAWLAAQAARLDAENEIPF